MSENGKHSEVKRSRWKRWVIALGVAVVILAGLRLLLKSDFLFDRLRPIAEKQANSLLNGNLSINSISGDLLNGVAVTGAVLQDQNGETVLSLDSLRVEYGIWALLWSPHTIDEAGISGLNVYVTQEQDSVWNIMKLVDASADETEPAETLQWALETFSLENGALYIRSEQLLPDGYLNITDIDLEASAGVGEEGFYGNLRQLELYLQEDRLPESVRLMAEGSADGGRITLESFVLNTGRSLVQAAGSYSTDGDVRAQSGLNRISWRDIAVYMEDFPLASDLEVNLGASGSLSELTLSMHAQADGLESLRLAVTGSVGESIMLTALNMEIENLDSPVLTGNEDFPRVGRFSYNGEGNIMPENPEQMVWSGDLSLNEVIAGDHRMSSTTVSHQLGKGKVDATGAITLDDQNLRYSFDAAEIFSDEPQWNGRIEGSRINPALWLNNDEYEGNLNILAELSGIGFDRERFESSAEIRVDGDRVGSQEFASFIFEGNIDPGRISGSAGLLLQESEVTLNAEVRNWQAEPAYDFDIMLNAFNAAEITYAETELLPTRLNGAFSGSGMLFDPEFMSVNAVMQFDSSFVNGEEIETLRAQFRVENSRFIVEEAQLESPIADASITLNQHLFEITNPSNTLDFTARLKNLDPIAAQFGLTDLRSEGSIQGSLTRNNTGILQFDAEALLTEIAVDTLFRATELNGSATAFLKNETEAELQIEVIQPVINEFELQDISINLVPVFSGGQIMGRMGFEIVGDERNSISQQGDFRADSSLVRIRTDRLNFTTRERTLSLDEPFGLYIEEGTVRSDTMRIESPGNTAYLSLWIPGIDSTRQEVGLEAENLNLSAIQSVMMEDPLFQGTLSGSAYINRRPDILSVRAAADVTGFTFNGGEMDSVRFDLQIENEWLNGHMAGWHREGRIFEGSLLIPYLPGDPLTFDDRFFDREIEGRFELVETDLSYLLGFANQGYEPGSTDTEARMNFIANLSGEAGNPQLDGRFQLREGVLSGIRIDSVDVDLSYIHDVEEFRLDGLVVAQEDPVLRFDAAAPLIIDLKRAEVVLPADDDSVSIDLTTDNFNLAVINDFADPGMVRQVKGMLNGDVSVSGTIGNLKPSGRMELSDGSVRIVPAGITISQIGALMNVEPDRLDLQQFTMNSGPGQISASGSLMYENLTPGKIDLTIRGDRFRAANSSEYNALIDLDASLSGTFQEPDLRGGLTFVSGFINLENFGETAVEDVRLEEEEEAEPVEFYESLAMEMNISFPGEFQIRNRQYLDMEIELGGSVDLVKNREQDLQMFGSLLAESGYARPLGKNFVLDEGSVTFTGPADDPGLNVVTRYEPPQSQDVRIFYIIEGTAQNPEFRFDSEPQLELQDIISYTLFGKPFYELESWEQVVAGSGSSPSAADIALDVLLDRVELLASQQLGIDVVEIDNTGSGSSSTTSVKTGWYLNQRTFFAILNEIGSSKPKTLFILEYLLRENLELIITQGDDSREGIDLRWNYDY
ncbi:translocation/assembly module TamB domain-containing protein [Rhodohalobacter mucosus]|uniref:Translocation and assembly module TamB C-terminal domain-containing protein n=1 Tax=Rhodohalobacter mucosus TaxID=2079485 RepID=A0A316TU12_9BACT|nr:translocation/assembly module TamB domain-containing protein [Rhodohalobacter mucosus]PWN07910.1 hypothetical protein DDZ15_02555 [Rhodohalobacter mucosus]